MTGPTPKSPGFINGPLYKVARFGTEYAAVPPNFHRLYNAIGLTAGLYVGRKLMDIMAGQTPDGKPVEKSEVPLPLRPLHGILHYDHFSDDPGDRWMKVFDRLVPATVGAMGACMGSSYFFKDAFINPVEKIVEASAKNPETFTLFDAERVALYHQSKPWNTLTGISALFGSASGSGLFPSIGHYGADLGTLFAMRSERSAAPLGHLVNANSHFPLRPTKLIKGMVEYAAGNSANKMEQLEACAHGILKTWFRDVKPEQVKKFTSIVEEQRAQFLKNGKLPADAEKAVAESLNKLVTGTGLEKTLISIGLDPREASIGDQGFVSIVGQLVGNLTGQRTSEKLEITWKQLISGIEKRHPELVGKTFDATAHKFKHDAVQKMAAGAAVGIGVTGFGLISGAKDTSIYDLKTKPIAQSSANAPANDDATNKGAAAPATNTDTNTSGDTNDTKKAPHVIHSRKDRGFINGKALDAAEGITDCFNVVNGVHSHRLYCAVGLTVGSWITDEFMKAMTGVNFLGHAVKKENVLKPLQKIYKCMAFNPHSDLPADKWMQVLRWALPDAIGAATIVYASTQYFMERNKKSKNATYLDEVEDKASNEQAKPWAVGVSLTAPYGGSSGFAWIPGINYMTHLGTRYSIASGRKVSMPGVGKFWSNNDTLFPFAPPGMIDLMIKEAVNNKSYNPELLETYAIGILKPWFDNVTPEQVEKFVNHVYEVRDQFYKDGGVPEEWKKDLEKALTEHLKGAGLEETLRESGLDPLQATIGNNGFSGKIAESVGARKTLEKIRSDYRTGYMERLQKSQAEQQSGSISLE